MLQSTTRSLEHEKSKWDISCRGLGGAKNSDIVFIIFICTSIIILNESDPRSNVHYLGSSENKA